MKIGYCRHCSSSELICANKDHDIRLCQHDPCDQKWVTEIKECPKGGKKPVKIVCPECGSIQDAIEDHTTIPFSTLIHECTSCEYMIMESEWEYAD